MPLQHRRQSPRQAPKSPQQRRQPSQPSPKPPKQPQRSPRPGSDRPRAHVRTTLLLRGLILFREVNELIWTPEASTLFEAKTAGFQLQNRRKQAAKSVDASGVRFDSFTSRKSIRPETKPSDPDAQKRLYQCRCGSMTVCHSLNRFVSTRARAKYRCSSLMDLLKMGRLFRCSLRRMRSHRRTSFS